MTVQEWYTKKYYQQILIHPAVTPHPLTNSLPGVLLTFTLTIYAVIQTGPLHNFTGKYCSPSLLFNKYYAVFALVLSGLFRAYIVIMIAWVQYNILHLILEYNPHVTFVAWVWAIILLLHTNLQVTHVTYNILTQFKLTPNIARLKYAILLFAIAYLYDFTHFQNFMFLLAAIQVTSISFYLLVASNSIHNPECP
jgi:hypothetical protein